MGVQRRSSMRGVPFLSFHGPEALGFISTVFASKSAHILSPAVLPESVKACALPVGAGRILGLWDAEQANEQTKKNTRSPREPLAQLRASLISSEIRSLSGSGVYLLFGFGDAGSCFVSLDSFASINSAGFVDPVTLNASLPSSATTLAMSPGLIFPRKISSAIGSSK